MQLAVQVGEAGPRLLDLMERVKVIEIAVLEIEAQRAEYDQAERERKERVERMRVIGSR
jgi:hypothetical protein